MTVDLQVLARRGAEIRLQEIRAEIATLEQEFPALVNYNVVNAHSVQAALDGAVAAPEPRKRPHWTSTPAGKRRLSRALRKAWRVRKAATQQ